MFILDVPVEITEERIGDQPDRMESKGKEFLGKVRQGFIQLTENFNWPLIDATRSIEDIHQDILSRLDS